MIRTMNPDQSIMPLWGSIRRTGARIGSVAWKRKVEIWLRPVGSTHDMSIRPSTSAQSAISRNWRKFERKAVPTSRVYRTGQRMPARSELDSMIVVVRPVPVLMRPLPEDGPSDADDRGALLDRDLEVLGHAHR
jgi:hypothetical protein